MANKRTADGWEAGFGRGLITPPRGVSLAGYFGPRYNRGVLDDIFVKAFLLRNGRSVVGVVAFDLVNVSDNLEQTLRQALRAAVPFADRLILCATHAHTGPETRRCREDFDARAIARVVRETVHAVRFAEEALAPVRLYAGSVRDNPFAYCRRYWMKDGRVVTNPGKLNPEIVRPENPVDREIGLLRVEQDGRIIGVLANIVNHTDTIGGDLVSSDWPGFLERSIQKRVGGQIPVVTLIGASGDVNHFDVSTKRGQTCYDEARRIGEGYADIVGKALSRLKEIRGGTLSFAAKRVAVPYRAFSKEELAEARRAARPTSGEKPPGALTSEDLAKGTAPAKALFARQFLAAFRESRRRKTRVYTMRRIGVGKAWAMLGFPGEIFCGIGRAVKNVSPYANTFVVTLADGHCGYVPQAACFGRGGYETRPVPGGACREDTEERLIRAGRALLGGRRGGRTA